MRVGTLLLLAAAVLLVATGSAVATDNTAPMPEAGVDQTVTVNSTVHLDGNGSVDPDGEITNVSWTIETPGGDTMAPDCRDCRRTEFNATAVGQYTVTLTVTDDDGATRSDTLYVSVTDESGPDVSLSGPDSTRAGTNATVTANVAEDDASLQSITWLVNGSVTDRESLNGSSSTASFTHSFDSTTPVQAVVYDTLGNRGSATRQISVRDGGGGSGDYQCFDQLCGDGADKKYVIDGQTYYAETNNDDGIQTYRDSELVTIENPTESEQISKTDGGTYKVDGSLTEVDDVNVVEAEDESDKKSSESGGNDGGDSIRRDPLGRTDHITGIGPSPGTTNTNDDGGSSDDDSGSTSDAGSSIGGDDYRSGIMF